MKIFDCFMYFDEDIVLDVRLNYLDKYIDQFIIIESEYNHKGEKRNLVIPVRKNTGKNTTIITKVDAKTGLETSIAASIAA